VQRAHFTGTVAEKRFMERRWCERLRQAMLRVDKRKRNASIRAVERAAKRQCKKDERQMEALLARMRNWTAHMFDVNCANSVTCKAALVEECLKDARAVAKSAGEKLPWLECLPKGIRESERQLSASHLKRWEECGAKAGEFMVVREAEHENEISTDDEDEW
jgi:arginine decarboxylase-like protein